MGQFQFEHNFHKTADRAFTINPLKLSAVSGQWSVVSGQRSAVSGQRSAFSSLLITDY
ncbi:hypothetical protein [Moorena sp. SIO3H5]|uniref:hypothetical protein n=1 Tax=Moorena sp. SIO3H5 TaxID=2607834 RepID=UPI0013BD32A8|nr:hypothetical protein [Moorena sp. SIO3H5]NEO73830.1 hypothetical protein [Moorena sp. SIO3H5]